MVKISKFGEDFLLLALRIDKHIKGYVDFYFGPEKLKQIVKNESIKNPNRLLIDANDFEIFSKEEIYNRINLLNNHVHSTTTFSYYLGTKLILDKFSEYPSVRSFKELLTKPLLPSDLI